MILFLTIQAIQGIKVPLQIRGLVFDIQSLASLLHSSSSAHVKREGNVAAHLLASKFLKDVNFACNPWLQYSFVFGCLPLNH